MKARFLEVAREFVIEICFPALGVGQSHQNDYAERKGHLLIHALCAAKFSPLLLSMVIRA